MMIQIRGTSGSGKTTVMKQLMEYLGPNWTPVYEHGRKNPLYYFNPKNQVVILGHYETPTGGCDTLGGGAPKVFAAFEKAVNNPQARDFDVLAEGLMLSEDIVWTKMMKEMTRGEAEIYFLSTPLAVCIQRVEARRAKAGRDRTKSPLNVPKTVRRGEYIEGMRHKLLDAGVSCHRVSSDNAARAILLRLGFTLTNERTRKWIRNNRG